MPTASFGHTTSLRMNLEKVYDQKERAGKRKFGYGRLRGGVIGVLVKNHGGVSGYQRPSVLHSRYII
jgi:hypothetical protein